MDEIKVSKSVDKYVAIGKTDAIFYLIMTVIIFFVLLFIAYKVDWYYILFADILLVLRTLEKVEIYFNLKKLNKYIIENDLGDKIGNIDFWNERNYFLTDNYMIIII